MLTHRDIPDLLFRSYWGLYLPIYFFVYVWPYDRADPARKRLGRHVITGFVILMGGFYYLFGEWSLRREGLLITCRYRLGPMILLLFSLWHNVVLTRLGWKMLRRPDDRFPFVALASGALAAIGTVAAIQVAPTILIPTDYTFSPEGKIVPALFLFLLVSIWALFWQHSQMEPRHLPYDLGNTLLTHATLAVALAGLLIHMGYL